MPNWVYINLNMKDLCKKEELFSVKDDGKKYLDFNKIIPEPKTKEELCMLRSILNKYFFRCQMLKETTEYDETIKPG